MTKKTLFVLVGCLWLVSEVGNAYDLSNPNPPPMRQAGIGPDGGLRVYGEGGLIEAYTKDGKPMTASEAADMDAGPPPAPDKKEIVHEVAPKDDWPSIMPISAHTK